MIVNKNKKYSIRKTALGIFSLCIGLSFANVGEVFAKDNDKVKIEYKNVVDSELSKEEKNLLKNNFNELKAKTNATYYMVYRLDKNALPKTGKSSLPFNAIASGGLLVLAVVLLKNKKAKIVGASLIIAGASLGYSNVYALDSNLLAKYNKTFEVSKGEFLPAPENIKGYKFLGYIDSSDIKNIDNNLKTNEKNSGNKNVVPNNQNENNNTQGNNNNENKKQEVEKKDVQVELHGKFLKLNGKSLLTQNFKEEEELTLTLSPNEKNYPKSLLVNDEEKVGELVESNGVYTYKFKVEKNTDIRVLYQEIRKLTFVGEGLTSDKENNNKIDHGDSVTVSIDIPNGKSIKTFTETNYNSHGEVSPGRENINRLALIQDDKYVIHNLDYDTVLKIEYEDIPTTENEAREFTFNAATQTITDYNPYISGRKNIVIPKMINGVEVLHIADYAFDSKNIKTVTLPNTIKTIGENAFSNNELKEIILPNGLESIADQAFYNNKLTSITVPNTVTRLGVGAFANNKISSATLPDNIVLSAGLFLNNNFSTYTFNSNISEIPRRFLEGNKLTSIIIPDGVIKIGNKAFLNNELTNAKIADSVKNIEELAFANNNLKEVHLAEDAKVNPTAFDTTTKTNLPEKEIEEARASDFVFDADTGTIKEYLGNEVLVKIPEMINGVKVKKIGYTESGFGIYKQKVGAFEYDPYGASGRGKILKVILPSGLEVIDANAFKDNSIKEIELPNTLTTISDKAFINNSLENVTLPNSVTTLGVDAFKDNKIKSINLENVTTLGAGSLAGNNLSTVTLNENLTEISDELFAANTLTAVTLPKNITRIGQHAFNGSVLKEITIPNSVTEIGIGAFANNNISNLSVPESVTIIGQSAFSGNNIKTLEIKGNAEIKAKAFYKAGVTKAILADGVNISGSEAFGFNPLVRINIPKGTTKLGAYSFERNSLEEITLPDTLVEIADGAFEVNNLTNVSIPANVKIIGTSAFFNNQITNLILNEGVVMIGEGAFQKNNLTTINVPNSVTNINNGAFKENSILEVMLSTTTTNNNGFDENVVVKQK